MTHETIEPHGGTLVDLLVPAPEAEPRRCRASP
jgi:hypothetical protein